MLSPVRIDRNAEGRPEALLSRIALTRDPHNGVELGQEAEFSAARIFDLDHVRAQQGYLIAGERPRY